MWLLPTSAGLSAVAAKDLQGPAKDAKGGVEQSGVTDKMLSAKNVLVLAYGPPGERKQGGLFGEKLASASLAHAELTKAVQKWGRFAIVNDADKADLVLLVVEWEGYTSWGHNLQCHDKLLVYNGGALPAEGAEPMWQNDGGKWGGCSGAAQPVKELRKAIEKAEKARR